MGKTRERSGEEGEIVRTARARSVFQQVTEGARRCRKHVVEVANQKAAIAPLHLDLFIFEHLTVVLAKDRNENFVAELFLRGMPLDVKVRGVRTGRAILENIPPPFVLRAGDRHVIGDDVENLPEVVAAERFAEILMAGRAAEFFVYTAVVHHIVAVHAAFSGL